MARFKKRFNPFDLLKKLRLVDYLILVIILLGLIIAFKFFNSEEKWIEVTIFAPNLNIFQASSLNNGDTEKDPSGKEIARIENFQSYNAALESKTEDTNRNIFLNIKMLAKINPRSGELEYKNKVIKIGSPVQFLFRSSMINGTIVDLEGSNQSKAMEQKTITLKLYDQWPWYADSIKIGDIEKDESGEKIAEIISKEIVPAEITVTTASGDTLLRTDPRKVDITLKVKALAQKLGDSLIFRKNTSLMIGGAISLDVNQVRIGDAFITNIE